MREDDPIRALMRELVAADPEHREALVELEVRLRERFGGRRVYIRKGVRGGRSEARPMHARSPAR